MDTYLHGDEVEYLLNFRSQIEKNVKTAAMIAANLSQEPGSKDPLDMDLDMVSVKLGGSENVDLKMSRSLFLPAGPKTSRTLNNFP